MSGAPVRPDYGCDRTRDAIATRSKERAVRKDACAIRVQDLLPRYTFDRSDIGERCEDIDAEERNDGKTAEERPPTALSMQHAPSEQRIELEYRGEEEQGMGNRALDWAGRTKQRERGDDNREHQKVGVSSLNSQHDCGRAERRR